MKSPSSSAVMIAQLCFAIVAGLFFGSVKADDIDDIELSLGLPCYYSSPIYCWTDWFDSDNPFGKGDNENLSRLRRKFPGKICPKPMDIEARTLQGQTPEAAGDIIEISNTNAGFICRKKDQPDKECEDYKVRFSCPPPYCANFVCWTKWFNQDRPGGLGDWETLKSIYENHPGDVCEHPAYMEVVEAETMVPAIYTGEKFHLYNPTRGFVCLSNQQKDGSCKDYKIRFGCPCKDN